MESKKHFCSYEDCTASFARPSKLEIHVKTFHLKEPMFKCSYPECGKDYSQAAHLKRHIQKKHENVEAPAEFVCRVEGCAKKFVGYASYMSHRNLHHCKKYSCTYCSETFCKRERLKKHLYSHTGQTPFTCDECGLHFLEKHLFNKHKKQTHSHKTYKCTNPACNGEVIFDNINLLRKHMSVAHQTRHSCTHCNRIFSRKLFLEEHLAAAHNEGERNVYSCPYEGCNRVFYYVRSVHNHIRINHFKINFPCTVKNCFQILSTKQKFQNHLKNHENSDKGVKEPPKVKNKKSLAAVITQLTQSQEKILLEKLGPIQKITESL